MVGLLRTAAWWGLVVACLMGVAQAPLAPAPLAWHPDAAGLCWLHAPPTPDTAETRFLRTVVDLVARDPAVGAPLLNVLRRESVVVCVDHRQHRDFGAYDLRFGIILLNDTLSVTEASIIVVHEARHVDQAARGFAPSLDVCMREASRVVCAIEADAQAVATLFAWNLRSRGQPEVWDAWLRFDRYADIAQAFEAAIGQGASRDVAMGEAFSRWYASPWRVDTYERGAQWAYLYELDESKRIPSTSYLPGDFFDTLCRLPEGSLYPCSIPSAAR